MIPFHHRGRANERKGQELNLQGLAPRPDSNRVPSPVGLPFQHQPDTAPRVRVRPPPVSPALVVE